MSLLVLAAVVVAGLSWHGERQRERVIQVPPLQSPAFADDASAREREMSYVRVRCTCA